MLKTITICAAFVLFGTGAINAQQQEAALKKLEVPGAGFDIVVAMPKSSGAVIDQRRLPDPLVVTLAGGELAMAVDSDIEKMGLLKDPIYAFYVDRKNGTSANSVAVYLVPKSKPTTAAVR
jgi:hypothetical protein